MLFSLNHVTTTKRAFLLIFLTFGLLRSSPQKFSTKRENVCVLMNIRPDGDNHERPEPQVYGEFPISLSIRGDPEAEARGIRRR